MENIKICKTCGIEKDLAEFYDFKMRGITYKRNICKPCFNAQKSNKNKEYSYKPRIKTEVTEYKIERNYLNMLSNEEIEKIKLLVNKSDELLKLLDVKTDEIFIDENKANRTPRTFNIYDSLYNKLKDKVKNSSMNVSDLVNMALKKYLE